MTTQVLFVDDDLNVLQGYARTLRRQFQLDTAESGEAALKLIEGGKEYAVVISDMRMPGMDGLALLQAVKARTTETIRIMVTGNTDQQTAIAAINEGDVFRFLTKPCEPDVLIKTVQDGIEHYRLLRAEKELLEGTLAGSVQALGDTLALVNPEAFGRVDRITKRLSALATAVSFAPAWQIGLLATLSQIGGVIMLPGTLQKLGTGQALTEEEQQLHDMHPNIGSNLVAKIPRLEAVAEAIRYQLKNFDGSGLPRDGVVGAKIPLGARLLKVVVEFDNFESTGMSAPDAVKQLRLHAERYDPKILQALAAYVGDLRTENAVTVSIQDLDDTMIVASDLFTREGKLLLRKGQRISESTREKLANFAANGHIGNTIEVFPPQGPDQDDGVARVA